MQSDSFYSPTDQNDNQGSQQLHAEKNCRINQLLEKGTLWRASGAQAHTTPHAQNKPFISTGFPSVDALLHYRGWPLGQLIECLLPSCTQTLLTPFLPSIQHNPASKKNSSEKKPSTIILINPPHTPYQYGWEKSWPLNIYVISTKKLNNTLWACEQALRNNCSKSIFIWLPEKNIPFAQLRKLQLAASCNKQMLVAFRPQALAQQSSPAALRIKVTPIQHQKKTALQLHILKQPGCWGGQKTIIHWHSTLQNSFLPAKNWPVYQTKNQLSQIHTGIAGSLANASSETEQSTSSAQHSLTAKKWS